MWTGVEERFCDHHADAGARVLASLLGREPREVILHMGEVGVDVPPVPLLGDVCPTCGRRMPVRGHAAERGVCDACHRRLLMEMRAVKDAERRVRRESDVEVHRRLRGGD